VPGRSVAYRESAVTEFLQVPKDAQRAIRDALQRLAGTFPDIPAGLDVVQVRGTSTLWRLAIGEYRCVFRIEAARLVVFGVGLRPGFYLRFE
jgi:mRNA-degrading endonuclease RelE of RelBE toxin-antitoxin system